MSYYSLFEIAINRKPMSIIKIRVKIFFYCFSFSVIIKLERDEYTELTEVA